MRILLINPPVEDFYFTPQRAYPINLLYLGTALKNAGFCVQLLDAVGSGRKATLTVPPDFAYLKRYYQPDVSAFKLFHQYYRFGQDDLWISRQIKQFRPDVVGISANFTPYHESALRIARLAKAVDKNIIVVAGGRFATFAPRVLLKDAAVDFVLRGEAEESLVQFCQTLERGRPVAPGLCRRKGGRLMIGRPALIKDLDALAQPDRSLIDPAGYIYAGRPMVSLMASRGCGRACDFCAIRERFRWRKAAGLIAEMRDCFKRGIRHFNFEDDNINLHPQFARILDGISEGFSGQVSISFMNGLLSEGLDGPIRDKLLRAGLTHLDLSLASCGADPSAQAKLFKVAAAFSRKNIPVTAHFIVGFPGQAAQDCFGQLKMLAARPLLLGPSVYYPVFKAKKGKDFKFWRSACACYDQDMSRDEIITAVYFSRLINFLKQTLEACAGDRAKISLRLVKMFFAGGRWHRAVKAGEGYRFFVREFISEETGRNFFSGLKIKRLKRKNGISLGYPVFLRNPSISPEL